MVPPALCVVGCIFRLRLYEIIIYRAPFLRSPLRHLCVGGPDPPPTFGEFVFVHCICIIIVFVVSEAAVRGEAEELEMPTERYVQDLQQALTETESSITYSFCLAPSPPDRSSTVTLAYEKVQKNISVSKTTVISLCSIYVVIQITAGADV